MSSEPPFAADDLERWTNRRGCPIRLDVLMTRRGACGDDVSILMGTPLGANQAPGSTRMFGWSQEAIDRAAQLSPSATATGYRQRDYELWIDDLDPNSIFLVHPDHVERWRIPAAPGGCM